MSPASSTRVSQALELLQMIGIPREQQNERSALTLLALADIKPRKPWKSATAPLRRITEMMDWMRDHYEVRYAPNTRETIRRQTVHQFVQHGLLLENPDQPERPINSPKWCYQLTPAALKLISSFGTTAFKKELESFLTNPATGDLKARHRNLPREIVRLPDGMTIELSAGGQNTLIRSIIEEFTPRFVRKPRVLLLGDAADKEVLSNDLALAEIGIKLAARGKAPDVLVHDVERDWLIVIEAVTSHGPVDQKRKNELTQLFATARHRSPRSRVRLRISQPQNLHPLPRRHRLGNRGLDRGCAGPHDSLQRCSLSWSLSMMPGFRTTAARPKGRFWERGRRAIFPFGKNEIDPQLGRTIVPGR